MKKSQRQALLRRVLRSRPLRTQEELTEALAAEGAPASQVTLSRDLRELGFVKGPNGYTEPARAAAESGLDRAELGRTLAEFLVEIETAQNLVVAKTRPGGAGPVALALDRAALDRIVGTIAGDDTVFVATKDSRQAEQVRKELAALW